MLLVCNLLLLLLFIVRLISSDIMSPHCINGFGDAHYTSKAGKWKYE